MGEMDTPSCDRAVELLPWLLNGSLPAAEERALRRHLAGCAACHGELAATHRVGRAFGQHPDAETLVDYALGLPLDGPRRAALEAHLETCDSCRGELALVGSEGSVAPGPRAAAWRGWRPLALAASLVALLAVGALLLRGAPPTTAPEANVAVLDLLPESLRTRGVGGETSAAVDPSRSAAVVLVADLDEPFDAYRVRLIGAGTPRGEITGLEPSPHGDFTLLLPPTALQRELTLELEGLRGEAWVPLETYHLPRSVRDPGRR